MNFTQTIIGNSPAILKRKLGGEYFAPITLASTAFTNGVVKAGTPISASGTVANTADAVGILLNDTYAENPNGSLVKAFAVINLTVANANAGITIADAVKTALPLIVFEA